MINNSKEKHYCPKCDSIAIDTYTIGDILGYVLVGKCVNCKHNFSIRTIGDF